MKRTHRFGLLAYRYPFKHYRFSSIFDLALLGIAPCRFIGYTKAIYAFRIMISYPTYIIGTLTATVTYRKSMPSHSRSLEGKVQNVLVFIRGTNSRIKTYGHTGIVDVLVFQIFRCIINNVFIPDTNGK